MADYPGFDEEKVQHALDAAQRHNDAVGLQKSDGGPNILAGGEFAVQAQCISVTVQNNEVCLNLPLGIGSVCLPIPVSIPDGTAAEACLSICTTWGIPTGVKVTVSVAGHTIVTKSFSGRTGRGAFPASAPIAQPPPRSIGAARKPALSA